MAKKSKIAKNEQRKEIVARYAERRAELKAIIKNPNTSDEDRMDAQFELNRQPRDASEARVRNRDAHDGRPRGYLPKFSLSRVRMRGMAHRGELPCVRKPSWYSMLQKMKSNNQKKFQIEQTRTPQNKQLKDDNIDTV